MDKPQEPLGSNTSANSNPPIAPVGMRMAGLRSGNGPLSVRARPSSIKRDCDRRTTSTGRKCLVNVHAKSRLIPELYGHSGQKTKGQAGACPDRTRAIPCNVRRRAIRERRAINVQLARATERSITATPGIPSCLVSGISGHDLSNSQADSAAHENASGWDLRLQDETCARTPLVNVHAKTVLTPSSSSRIWRRSGNEEGPAKP